MSERLTISNEKEGKAFHTKGKEYEKIQRLEKAGVYNEAKREIGDSNSHLSQIVKGLDYDNYVCLFWWWKTICGNQVVWSKTILFSCVLL